MASVKHSVGAYDNVIDCAHRHHVANSGIGYQAEIDAIM
jgi:hypothetical protein